MIKIIDKRFLPKNNSVGSRQKFIDRYKEAIKSRIRDLVDQKSIKDFDKGVKKVRISKDALDEPEFSLNPDGNKDRIYIGNKSYTKGNKVQRPDSGQGKGREGGRGDDGEDDFEFLLSDREYLDLFFEDLELPDMLKKEFMGSSYEIRHAGLSRCGGPTSLNIKKTMLNALGRKKAQIKNQCDGCVAGFPLVNGKHFMGTDTIVCQKSKYQYIEDMDLRYNYKDKIEVPTTKAVMFCLLDVSGSMSELHKDLAKRFFILLNRFLKINYDIVDVVFVRHTEYAEEVDEQKFFYDRVNGGTIISSGYEKISEIINQRYNPEQWNIYIAQASDGDNWQDDNGTMENVLISKLLPITQHFAYIDISTYGNSGSDVFNIMDRLKQSHKNLQAKTVRDYKDIFPVFRSLFKKGKE